MSPPTTGSPPATTPDPALGWRSARGTPLYRDTPHTLHDGERRWPVVADIPWLRAGREQVREQAVAALDAGDPDRAAVVLLGDADDWWDQPRPPDAQLRAALAAPTLRAAVELLGLGRVGTYFVHRWSDPSWLAALALTAAHPPGERRVVDLACGAGHLLRHLALHGTRNLTGVDVVFAKLWLARRFVVPPDAPVALVCADLRCPWPLPEPAEPQYVACHDALYFLAGKQAFVAAARAHAGLGGAVLLGHCNNASHPTGRAGLPLDPSGWAALLPGARCYAEEELTASTLDGRMPRPAPPGELGGTEAVGLALDEAGLPPQPALAQPPPSLTLRPNPLYVDGHRRWPDERWAAEYGDRAGAYLPERWADRPRPAGPGFAGPDPVRHRLLVDLPERW